MEVINYENIFSNCLELLTSRKLLNQELRNTYFTDSKKKIIEIKKYEFEEIIEDFDSTISNSLQALRTIYIEYLNLKESIKFEKTNNLINKMNSTVTQANNTTAIKEEDYSHYSQYSHYKSENVPMNSSLSYDYTLLRDKYNDKTFLNISNMNMTNNIINLQKDSNNINNNINNIVQEVEETPEVYNYNYITEESLNSPKNVKHEHDHVEKRISKGDYTYNLSKINTPIKSPIKTPIKAQSKSPNKSSVKSSSKAPNKTPTKVTLIIDSDNQNSENQNDVNTVNNPSKTAYNILKGLKDYNRDIYKLLNEEDREQLENEFSIIKEKRLQDQKGSIKINEINIECNDIKDNKDITNTSSSYYLNKIKNKISEIKETKKTIETETDESKESININGVNFVNLTDNSSTSPLKSCVNDDKNDFIKRKDEYYKQIEENFNKIHQRGSLNVNEKQNQTTKKSIEVVNKEESKKYDNNK